MFIDINILIDSRKVDYDYKIKDGRLYISFKIEPNKKKLIIHYDSNIYDDFKVETGDFKDKDGYLEIDLMKNNLNFFEFSMKANFKYYVKLVYDQVQHNYKKEELIEMLKSLYELNKEEEILDRIKVLEELNIEDKFLYYEIDHFINDILIENPYYKKLMDKMDDFDALNIITYNLMSNKPYSITQEQFNDLVEVSKKHDYTLENMWRLAMNYDEKGYDFSKIEEYLIESRDVYYLGEYISAIYQKNTNYIVDLIIKTGDNEYVKKVLDNEFITRDLSSEQIDKLKKVIN